MLNLSYKTCIEDDDFAYACLDVVLDLSVTIKDNDIQVTVEAMHDTDGNDISAFMVFVEDEDFDFEWIETVLPAINTEFHKQYPLDTPRPEYVLKGKLTQVA